MGNIKAQIPEPSHGTASVWGAGRSRVLGWTQTGLIGCCWGTREELWKGLSRSCPVSIRHPFHNGIHKYIKGSKSRLSSTAAGTLILSNLTVMVKTFLICNLLVLPSFWPCINEGFEQGSQTSFNQDKVIVPTAFFFYLALSLPDIYTHKWHSKYYCHQVSIAKWHSMPDNCINRTTSPSLYLPI